MKTPRRYDLVNELFDFMVVHSEGATQDQMAEALGVSVGLIQEAIRSMRWVLGDDDTINLPCSPDPDNPKGQWIYHLVGNMDGIIEWEANRVSDMETRLYTMHQVVSSVDRAIDSRTRDGKRARIMRKGFARILEDLKELEVSSIGE